VQRHAAAEFGVVGVHFASSWWWRWIVL
jgi:hypothetical protein